MGQSKDRMGQTAVSWLCSSHRHPNFMSILCLNSVFNVKALVGAFNKDKVLVGAL